MTEAKEPFWTPEREEELRTLWAMGKSGGQIATHFGGVSSRSQVLGKIHRLGLQRSPEAVAASKLRQSLSKPRQSAKPSPDFVKAAKARRVEYAREAATRVVQIFTPKTPPKLLMELGRCDCRWPISTPEEGRGYETLFCAAVVKAGKVYCVDHQAKATVATNHRYDQPIKPKDFNDRPVSTRSRPDPSEIGLDGVAA